MGLPRSKYVKEGEEGVYHCFSRCVRRAFLCGFDAVTGQDFSHRKAWVVARLRYLAAIFAIDVCDYSILENHYHTVLRVRPDIAAGWSDLEVASRWLTLFPKRRPKKSPPGSPTQEEIRALADCPDRIVELRKRLSSLSWFMGKLNEFIARAANKEDKVKGRFWDGRFKCQRLLDEAAIAACMVYVDLNVIRAGLAETPEGSDFTGIQERIRAWQKETEASNASKKVESTESSRDSDALSGFRSSPENAVPNDCWLCPLSSDSQRRGILQMSPLDYFDLVDQSGRLFRSDKRGSIPSHLAPILQRIGVNAEAWLEVTSSFGSQFHLAAGLTSNMRSFANRLGRRWLKGIEAAKTFFSQSRAPSLRGLSLSVRFNSVPKTNRHQQIT